MVNFVIKENNVLAAVHLPCNPRVNTAISFLSLIASNLVVGPDSEDVAIRFLKSYLYFARFHCVFLMSVMHSAVVIWLLT